MRLMHPRLPWYVDVQSANGITVYDVLRTLFEKLKRQIVAQDFYNEELDARDREIVTRAFQDRFSMNGWESAREEKLKGVKQVDFLGEEFIFVGLERRNDMWEIKTTKK
ncbi:hypothetical protein DFH09DRAFT_942750 [Mycena vulgaris]|nr:hypothetical protein DFH09DRAFT_942750 [Mycena vulgaris]